MEIMDIMDQISELVNTICATKAVAASFAQRFAEGTPEDYNYNFYALFDLICEARDKVKTLESTADAIICKKGA